MKSVVLKGMNKDEKKEYRFFFFFTLTKMKKKPEYMQVTDYLPLFHEKVSSHQLLIKSK